jgi:hypothetical protein
VYREVLDRICRSVTSLRETPPVGVDKEPIAVGNLWMHAELGGSISVDASGKHLPLAIPVCWRIAQLANPARVMGGRDDRAAAAGIDYPFALALSPSAMRAAASSGVAGSTWLPCRTWIVPTETVPPALAMR